MLLALVLAASVADVPSPACGTGPAVSLLPGATSGAPPAPWEHDLLRNASRCTFIGGRVPCARAEREALRTLVGDLVASRRTHTCETKGPAHAARVRAMHPIFPDEEWPSFLRKRVYLRKGIKPFLGAALEPAEQARIRRRVFLDLGSRSFASSTAWFLKTYPGAERFEVHGFDMDPSYGATWARSAAAHNATGRYRFHGVAVSTFDGLLSLWHTMQGNAMQNLGGRAGGDMVCSRVRVANLPAWLGTGPGGVLGLTEADFVVAKMDIDGAEFNVIPALLATGAMRLIDELFIEFHHSRWSWKQPPGGPPSPGHKPAPVTSRCTPERERALLQAGNGSVCVHRHEAYAWLQLMRDNCVFVHEWT